MFKSPLFYLSMGAALICDVIIFLAGAWIIQWLISLTGGYISFGTACIVNLVLSVLRALGAIAKN